MNDTPHAAPAEATEHKDQSAMQDHRIIERLQECPEDPDAQLDAALDASMDGSDPISIAQPGRTSEPAPTDGQHGEDPEVRSNA